MSTKKAKAKAKKVVANAKYAVRKCAVCGKTFAPKAENAKYCTKQCKAKAKAALRRKARAAKKAGVVAKKAVKPVKPMKVLTVKKPVTKKPVAKQLPSPMEMVVTGLTVIAAALSIAAKRGGK